MWHTKLIRHVCLMENHELFSVFFGMWFLMGLGVRQLVWWHGRSYVLMKAIEASGNLKDPEKLQENFKNSIIVSYCSLPQNLRTPRICMVVTQKPVRHQGIQHLPLKFLYLLLQLLIKTRLLNISVHYSFCQIMMINFSMYI